jgi:hypothetical protein
VRVFSILCRTRQVRIAILQHLTHLANYSELAQDWQRRLSQVDNTKEINIDVGSKTFEVYALNRYGLGTSHHISIKYYPQYL